MNTKIIIPFIILILLTTITTAISFPYPGYNDNIGGTSYFDNANAIEESSKATSDPGFMPLIEDLNNDGTKEIIILDDANVEIYHGSTLTTVDAIAFAADPHTAYVYDIDGDASNEIIVLTESNTSILSFNGTNIAVQYSVAHGFLEASAVIGCRGTNDCVIIEGTSASAAYARTSVFLHVLTSTNLTYNDTAASSYEITYETSGSSSTYYYTQCPANIPYLQIEDVDTDGTKEFLTTIFFDSALASSKVKLVSFNYNTTGMIQEWIYSKSTDVYNPTFTNSLTYCTRTEYTIPRIISSPLTFDFDGFPSNGLETVFAYMKDSNEFKMVMISGTGTLLDTYPSILDADGVIVSNPVLMNAFSDTGQEDFCVMGYSHDINEIDLSCGSAQTSGVESKEFNYAVGSPGNIALGTQYYVDFIQNINRVANYNDGNNLDDVITPYGIFYIDYDLDNELIPVYLSPHLNASHVSVDVNGDGRDDIIELGANGLVYWSDGFTDHQVEITKITQNPASPICTNTTLTFQTFLTDGENDAGNCTYNYYYINSTLKETYNVSFTHGQSSVIQQITNTAAGIYSLTVTCQDDTSLEDADVATINNIMVIDSDSTGANCYDWNEATSETITNTTEAAAESVANEEFKDDVTGLFEGLGVASTTAKNIISIIIMLIVGIAVFVYTQNIALALTTKVSVMLILFYLGMLSIFPFIVIIIVAVAAIVWSLMKGGGGQL